MAVAFATVGTAKRERKKANKAARQVREFRQQRIDNARRRATKWGTLIVVALGLVVGIATLGGAFSSDDVAATHLRPPTTRLHPMTRQQQLNLQLIALLLMAQLTSSEVSIVLYRCV